MNQSFDRRGILLCCLLGLTLIVVAFFPFLLPGASHADAADVLPPCVDQTVENVSEITPETDADAPLIPATDRVNDYMEAPSEQTEAETIPASQAPETLPETETVRETLDPKELTLGDVPTEEYYYSTEDIPLTKDQQRIAIKLAKEYGVPTELLYGIMRTETHYQTDLISKTQDYGIMQINVYNHDWLRRALGVSDFLDFEQNVRCGAYILTYYTGTYENVAKILMCYNLGEGGAQAAWKKGETFNTYCEKVIGEMNRLLAIRYANPQ